MTTGGAGKPPQERLGAPSGGDGTSEGLGGAQIGSFAPDGLGGGHVLLLVAGPTGVLGGFCSCGAAYEGPVDELSIRRAHHEHATHS